MKTKIDSTIRPLTYICALDSVASSLMGYTDEMLSDFNTRHLGSFIDPITGRTDVQFFTNYIPAGPVLTSGYYFGTNPKLDSMYLTVAISGYRGDTVTGIDVEVYEVIKGDFPSDKIYYTNKDMTPYLNDTALVTFKQTSKGGHYAKLPMEFVKKFGIDNFNDNPYESYSKFKERYKGLYFKAKPHTKGEGAIYIINMTQTNMKLFYTNDEKDSTSASFLMNADKRMLTDVGGAEMFPTGFETAQHNYTFADPSKGGVQIAQIGDSTIQTERGFVQGFSGLSTVITFPQEQLEVLKEKVKLAGYNNIAVHAAELVFEVDDPQWENLDKMFPDMAAYYSLPQLKFMPDYQPLNNYPFTLDGSLNRSRNTYTLNITSYVQGLLTGRIINNKIQLGAPISNYLSTGRSMLKGSASLTPPKLILTYTMLK